MQRIVSSNALKSSTQKQLGNEMFELSYRPLRYRDRWFAYLDLLGFTELVQTNSIEDVLPVYSEALQRMRAACKLAREQVGLINSWFSDTFIIYSRSDSLKDFVHLESAARIFFQLLIMKHIPVRGCISHGKLYSQAKRNIFVGPALIEAHCYGEALNWVGFCLAPSVVNKFKNNLPNEQRTFYRQITDKKVLKNAKVDQLQAFAFTNGTVTSKSQYKAALETMKQTAPPKAVSKYQNALAFLDKQT